MICIHMLLTSFWTCVYCASNKQASKHYINGITWKQLVLPDLKTVGHFLCCGRRRLSQPELRLLLI